MPPTPTGPRRRGVGRWIVRGLAALTSIAIVAVCAVYLLSARQLRRTYAVHEYPLTLVSDSATVARGARIATLRGCRECHGQDLGGRVLADDPLFGRLVTPNLTGGGRGSVLTPVDWERAVRHGVRRDGRSLLIMPAHEFQGITDEDLTAVASFATTLPVVHDTLPSFRLGPLARALLVAGKLDELTPAVLVSQAITHRRSIPVEATPAYGEYLVASCRGCHGPGLSGGPMPGPGGRPARNITPDPATGIGRWSEAEFAATLRTGRLPDGVMLDTTAMPVAITRHFDEVEVRAIYAYLHTLPARPYGNR